MGDKVLAGPDDLAFCVQTKQGLRPLTYRVFQAQLKQHVHKSGWVAAAFSSHSLHCGGVSLDYKAKVPGELIKVQRDWDSAAYMAYLSIPLEQRIQVATWLSRAAAKKGGGGGGGGGGVSTSVWGRYCLHTTSVVHLFAGFPDSKPIKVITDSIGKAFPTHRLWSHHMQSSKIFKDATERKISGDIRVGSLRVIVFHLGTDSRDYRGWGGKVSCQQQLSSMQEEVKALYMPVRRLNSTCFIVFLAVLSHGCDWQHTQKLHLAFNHFLQSFTRGEQCGFMPTFAPFIYKDGPMKGHSIESLFAVRDGGLHLNLMGHHAGVHRSVQIGIVVKAAT